MQPTAHTAESSFTKNRVMALLNVLFGIVLLTGCNSGSNAPATGTYTPGTSPPGGGGGGISTGGNSPTQIGTPYSTDFILSPPQIALNDSDTAVAVWQETFQAGAQKIWAAVRSNNAWGTATAIDTLASADPRVAMDPNGQIIVVWSRNSPTGNPPNNTLWSLRYIDGRWQTAQLISKTPTSDNTAYPLSPAVATDSNGHIMVVWTDNGLTGSSTRSIWATHYDGSNWSPAQTLSDGTHTAYEARVAASGLDNFTVVWTQDTNVQAPPGPAAVTMPNLWTRRYSSGTWSTAAVPIGLTGLVAGDGATHLNLSMNSGGGAIVVWEQTHGTQVSIASNRYQTSAGWGTATLIDNAGTPASAPVVALDNTGNAIAVWRQADGTTLNAWTSGSSAGASWQIPTRLGSPGVNVENIRIGMDMAGNALTIWQQNPMGSFNPALVTRRYLSATGGWGNASTLSLAGTDMALDVNSAGKALVVAKHSVNNGLGPLTAPWALLYQP